MLTTEQKIRIVDLLGKAVWNLPVYVLRNALGLVSVKDAAKSLGVGPDMLRYAIKKKYVPAPTVAVKKRRFYTPADVQKMKTLPMIPEKWPGETVAEMKKLAASGMSQKAIGKKFKTTQSTVSRLLRFASTTSTRQS
jgi:hypothetical protein